MIKKKPKKLIEAFDLIKKGEIESGLIQASNFQLDFSNEINFAKSEISAFKNNWQDCFFLCKENLINIDNWFLQNIFIEQMSLFVACSLNINKVDEALIFIEEFVEKFKDSQLYLKNHKSFIDSYVIPNLRKKRLVEFDERIQINFENEDIAERNINSYLNKRSDLTRNMSSLWEYVFIDLITYGNYNELKKYYLENNHLLKYDLVHVDIAKAFIKCNDKINARIAFKNSLNYFVRPAHEQVLPIELIYNKYLVEIADDDFKNEILYFKKDR